MERFNLFRYYRGSKVRKVRIKLLSERTNAIFQERGCARDLQYRGVGDEI